MLARTKLNNVLRILPRFYSESAGQNQGTSGSSSMPPPSKVNAEVPGLSSAVIHPAQEQLGPGVDPNKCGPYKVPEYFCYDNASYFEAEVEMAKYRLPQPSALKK